MMTKRNNLTEVLESHRCWLSGEDGGTRANLSDANLSGANLSYANLSYASLSSAQLCAARGISWAAVSWPGHGECGRQLLAVRIGGVPVAFCGCFRGSFAQLREFIAGDDQTLAQSRLQALVICEALLAGVELVPAWSVS